MAQSQIEKVYNQLEEHDWEAGGSAITNVHLTTAKKTRSSGRKSLNPTKLVHRYMKYNISDKPFTEEIENQSLAESTTEAYKTVQGSEEDDTDTTAVPDKFSGDNPQNIAWSGSIQPVKWEKRLRLSATKYYTKQKRERQSAELELPENSPPMKQRIFSCLVCQQPFLDAAECYNHMLTHNINGQHTAPAERLQLSEKESDIQSLSDAVEADSDAADTEEETNVVQDSEPPLPGDTLDPGNEGKKPLELREQDRSFECQQCGKRFTEQRGLSQHMRVHVKNKSLTCHICSLVLPSYFLMTEHKRLHSGERPFKCAFVGCDRFFPDAHQARRHGRMHSKERPYVCPHCDKAFKAHNHLQEHLRLHTGERPFVCEVCGVGFAQSNGLKSHAKQHLLKEDNECDICHKTFPHPQSLSLHKQVHLTDRPFVCELCNKTFRTSCNLGAHRKLKHLNETDEKQFTCTECGAVFSKACNLGIHRKKKHSDQTAEPAKIFICNICDARFSEACNLGAHKKIKHAEESGNGRSVFDCTLCGARFYRACNLSGHIRRKHDKKGDGKESEKFYTCQKCGFLSSSLKDLRDHCSSSHTSSFPPNTTVEMQRNDKIMDSEDLPRDGGSGTNDGRVSCRRNTVYSQAPSPNCLFPANSSVDSGMAEDKEGAKASITFPNMPSQLANAQTENVELVPTPAPARYQQSTERTLLEKIWPHLKKTSINFSSVSPHPVAQTQSHSSLESSQHAQHLADGMNRSDVSSQRLSAYQAGIWDSHHSQLLQAFSKPASPDVHQTVGLNNVLLSREPAQKRCEPLDAGASASGPNIVDTFLHDVFDA